MEPTVTYYFPPEPPYLLFLSSLALGLACGRAFEVTLRSLVREWSTNRSTRTLLNLRGASIRVPYLGISLCVGVFLSTGLEVFGFPPQLAYPIGVAIAALCASIVWWQLGKLLTLLEVGGSAAIDLDNFGM